MTTSTATILPQINDLIGCMKKIIVLHAFWCNVLTWSATASSGRLRQKIEIFLVLLRFRRQRRASSSESFILCLKSSYFKTGHFMSWKGREPLRNEQK